MDAELVEVWRGDLRESVHRGHAVICDANGDIVQAWGDPAKVIYPRSSAKPIQALALVESGAAEGLSQARLALACASHLGAEIHTAEVTRWLGQLDLDASALRCGPQEPDDIPARDALIREGAAPGPVHNNCSGKHAGFLALARHLGAGPEYVEIGHPVQVAVKTAFEEVTGEDSPTWGIDGCSAPNFACTVAGLARAAARFAAATEKGVRGTAMVRLREAMMARPEMVAGEGHGCTALMRAAKRGAALKNGAEGVYFAAIPEQGRGIAVKITDGADRAAEAAMAALLVHLGVVSHRDPAMAPYFYAPIHSRRGAVVGQIRPAGALQGRTLGRLG